MRGLQMFLSRLSSRRGRTPDPDGATTTLSDAASPRKPWPTWRLALFLVPVVVGFLVPARVASGQVSEAVLALFQATARDVEDLLRPGCFQILIALIAIELVVFVWTNYPPSAGAAKGGFFRIAWWCYLFALVANHPSAVIGPWEIVKGAEALFGEITGLQGIDPETYLLQGVEVYATFIDVAWEEGFWGFATRAHDIGAWGLAALIHLASYVLVSLALFILLLQGTIMLALGPLAAAFGGSRWTVGFSVAYLNALLWWATKAILVAIGVRAGVDIAENTTEILRAFAATNTLVTTPIIWTTVVASLSFAVAVAVVPGMMATKLVGQSTFRIGMVLEGGK